jgi:hypothetical protein
MKNLADRNMLILPLEKILFAKIVFENHGNELISSLRMR